MFRLLSRLIAVTVLAASPLISVSVAQATSRDAWPVYPSLFYSPSTCNVANNFVVCQSGGLMQSQINSGYQCNEIDVVMNGLANGPVNITLSADSQSVSQTLSINEDGTYYVQFPGFLVNNLVSLEFSMPDGAAFPLPTIYSTPCPVATATPIPSSTSTPNPSFTPTATINPSYTVTPIPTYTPLPSGHSTFTPTRTPTAGVPTATPTPGTAYRNCGDVTYPLLNCDWVGSQGNTGPGFLSGTFWTGGSGGGGGFRVGCYNTITGLTGPNYLYTNVNYGGGYGGICSQTVTPGATGNIYMRYQANAAVNYAFTYGNGPSSSAPTGGAFDGSGTCLIGSGNWCETIVGTAVSGTGQTFMLAKGLGGSSDGWQEVYIERVWVSSSPSTPTAGPTATATATPNGPTATPTSTAIPNPWGTVTPVPSDTECPGGCAVTDLTQVPGLSTVVTVDTNPFSPLTHLSLARSSCQPFGYVQIPIPVITGTPALGQPLQFGWTAPITHTWDDTHLITNTAIQPCAMVGEVSPYVWDFTYWGSGVALAIVFTIWLIGWVGRLSGDHTIDG